MHKKSTPGKKTGARSRARAASASVAVGTDSKTAKGSLGFSHIPPSVGEILLSRRLSQLRATASSRQDTAAPAQGRKAANAASSLTNSAAKGGQAEAAAADWLDWVRIGLPIELAAHVVQVLLKGEQAGGVERQLIVFADSPGWCARLRYALLGLQERIRARDPAIRRLTARVLRLD